MSLISINKAVYHDNVMTINVNNLIIIKKYKMKDITMFI